MGAAASANVRGRLEYIAYLEAEVQMLRAEKQDALRKVEIPAFSHFHSPFADHRFVTGYRCGQRKGEHRAPVPAQPPNSGTGEGELGARHRAVGCEYRAFGGEAV